MSSSSHSLTTATMGLTPDLGVLVKKWTVAARDWAFSECLKKQHSENATSSTDDEEAISANLHSLFSK